MTSTADTNNIVLACTVCSAALILVLHLLDRWRDRRNRRRTFRARRFAR